MGNIILETIIAIVLICLTGLLIPWLRTKTTAAQQDTLNKVVAVLVRAAEMIHAGDEGSRKYSAVHDWLIDRGFTEDEAAIQTAIEAAVYQLWHDTPDI
ncbi:hypothetical protein FACS1894184_12820 [Clostridia bacterium]|nr:hypothetical protein FACS1894184_12820 [Clostridia bacterium]